MTQTESVAQNELGTNLARFSLEWLQWNDKQGNPFRLDYKLSSDQTYFCSCFRPGVNFINVLRAAFTHADPESAKKTVKSSSFFALLGSARVKAARRMLMKLNPAMWLSTAFGIVIILSAINTSKAGKGSSINDVTHNYFNVKLLKLLNSIYENLLK